MTAMDGRKEVYTGEKIEEEGREIVLHSNNILTGTLTNPMP